jgi:hypothetical protein
MTRMLSDMLASLNVVTAVVITLGGGAAGWSSLHSIGGGTAVVGILLGLLLGSLAAAAICGTLATLVLIENHLRNIAAVSDELRARLRKQ